MNMHQVIKGPLITEKLDRGSGTLGLLVNDPTLYEKATAAVTDVQQSVQDLGKVADRHRPGAGRGPVAGRVRALHPVGARGRLRSRAAALRRCRGPGRRSASSSGRRARPTRDLQRENPRDTSTRRPSPRGSPSARGADEGPDAPARFERAGAFQMRVDLGDGVRIDPQVDRELAHRWKLIADREFTSRLLVGTGKFAAHPVMRDAVLASGTELVTVALRRADQIATLMKGVPRVAAAPAAGAQPAAASTAAPATAMVDGDNGMGHLVVARAAETARRSAAGRSARGREDVRAQHGHAHGAAACGPRHSRRWAKRPPRTGAIPNACIARCSRGGRP